MPTYSDTKVDLVINKPTQSQFDSASGLDPTQLYFVEPNFSGNKVLQTSANGDIAESDEVPTTTQVLSATDSITLADGVIYNGSTQTSLTIAVPASATVGFLCEILFSSGSTPTTLPPNSVKWTGDDVASNVFTPVANKRYTAFVWYDGSQFVGSVRGIV